LAEEGIYSGEEDAEDEKDEVEADEDKGAEKEEEAELVKNES